MRLLQGNFRLEDDASLPKRLLTAVVAAGLALGAAAAGAVDLHAGPVYAPPGAGIEAFAGEAANFGGATLAYTDIDLAQTENLYFGLRSDLYLCGYSMDGTAITGGEIFRISSITTNSIIYSGTTTFHTDFPVSGVWMTPTRLTLTFTGAGNVVQDADTLALSGPMGDVGALWHVQGDNFTVAMSIEALVPPFDANAGNYEPANELFNRFGSLFNTATSFDWGFYYEALDSDGDGLVDPQDNCTQVANADQRDTNGDGYGNLCDPDLNNDGVINATDLGVLKSVFFTSDADADFDGNGAVNATDLGVMKSMFFLPPGPSGIAP